MAKKLSLESSQRWIAAHPSRAREVNKAANAKYKQRYPERIVAKNAINNAINRGKLARGVECRKCGSQDNIQAHHEDYSKPLDVMWLCSKCHYDLHSSKRISNG